MKSEIIQPTNWITAKVTVKYVNVPSFGVNH